MGLFEEQMFFMKIRYRIRAISLIVAAVLGGMALGNPLFIGAFLALAFSEIFKD